MGSHSWNLKQQKSSNHLLELLTWQLGTKCLRKFAFGKSSCSKEDSKQTSYMDINHAPTMT